jgi:hypothetical protein
MATEREIASKFIGTYRKLYLKEYGRKAKINIFAERWGAMDMIESVGIDRANEILVYYFQCDVPGHPLQQLWRTFDKLDDMMSAIDTDRAERARVREATKRRMAEVDES